MLARVLGPNDSKRYLDLRMKAAREEPESMTFDVERELAQVVGSGSVSVFMQEQPRIHWGVEHHGSLVGVFAASRRFNAVFHSHLWLWGMFVRPRYRGTGVSRVLMEAALKWSDGESKCDRLLTSFPEKNIRAERLMSRWDFRPVSEEESGRRIPGVLPGYLVVERARPGSDQRRRTADSDLP